MQHAGRQQLWVGQDPRHECARAQRHLGDVAARVRGRVGAQRRCTHHGAPFAPETPIALVLLCGRDRRAAQLCHCCRR
eukprot:5735849-Pleurochrysis_carterae.AAC.1